MMLDAHQPAVYLHVDARRRDSIEQQRQCRLGEGGFVDRPVDGVLPRGVPELVFGRRIRALVEQRFHQRGVAGARGQHQGRTTHRRQMVDTVDVAQPQDVLEVLRGIGLQVTLPQRGDRAQRQLLLPFPVGQLHAEHCRIADPAEVTLGRQTAGRLKVGARKLFHPGLLTVP